MLSFLSYKMIIIHYRIYDVISFNNSDKMTANEYVDGYWVNSNGVWSR